MNQYTPAARAMMDKVDSSLLVRALSDGRDSVPRGTPATALPKLLYPIINDALDAAFQPMQRISIQAYPGFLKGLDLAHAETTNYKALAPLVTTAIATWRDAAQRLQNVGSPSTTGSTTPGTTTAVARCNFAASSAEKSGALSGLLLVSFNQH